MSPLYEARLRVYFYCFVDGTFKGELSLIDTDDDFDPNFLSKYDSFQSQQLLYFLLYLRSKQFATVCRALTAPWPERIHAERNARTIFLRACILPRHRRPWLPGIPRERVRRKHLTLMQRNRHTTSLRAVARSSQETCRGRGTAE